MIYLKRQLSSIAFEIHSLIVGKSEKNRFMGLKTRKVRLDNFQTNRCLYGCLF